MAEHEGTTGWHADWAAQVTEYALAVLDPSGVVVSWSPGATLLHGDTVEQAVGQHLSRFFPPDDLVTDLPGRLLEAAREQGSTQYAGWRRHRDGTWFWAEVTITALRDAEGERSGFATITRDRTEQHRTEELLRESEERFRTLVSQVADYAIIGLDPSGVITSWNAGAALVKGYTDDEAVGEHFSMFYTAEDRRHGLPAQLLEAARHDGRVENRGWRVRKDGSRFWADVVITAIRDDDGRLRGYAKVTRDLTEQHEVEEELIRSEQRFRLLVSQVSEYAIIGLDQSGVITSWNVGAEKLKGWRTGDALGSHHSMFYTEADRRADLPARLLREAREAGSVEQAGWRVRRDGTAFWAQVTITAVRDARGTLQGFTKVTRDTTEAHRLTEARDSFISGLTHDFRSPLTAIGGFASLLAGRLEDPELKKYATHVLSGAERLRRLVDLMLENSRLEAGAEVLDCRELELLGFLHETVTGLGAELDGREVHVHGDQTVACVDERALGRVLANLLGNAVKYSPSGSALEIDLRRQDRVARITVSDRGRGIDPADAEQLFEQFQRGGRAQLDGGLGLGLAVVRALVRQMGGEARMRPRPGGGTEVEVDLPLAGTGANTARTLDGSIARDAATGR